MAVTEFRGAQRFTESPAPVSESGEALIKVQAGSLVASVDGSEYAEFSIGAVESVTGDGVDNTDPQNPVVLGTFQLLETKGPLLAAQTTLSFTGLDGNSDGIYKLVIEAISGATATASIRLNGDSSNHRSGGLGNDSTGTPENPYGEASATVGVIGYIPTAGYRAIMEVTIAAKTGAVRVYSADSFAFYSNNTCRKTQVGGAWTDTSSNLSQIDLVAGASNGWGIGTVATLYRLMR